MEQRLLHLARQYDDTVESVQDMAHYRNRIYSAAGAKGKMVLRLIDGEKRTAEQIGAELLFQRYLYEHGAGVARPLETAEDGLILSIEHGGRVYHASAFAYVQGDNWYDRDDWKPEILFSIGRTLGRIHALSRAYRPSGSRRRMWWEQQELARAERVFREYSAELHAAFRRDMADMLARPTDSEVFGLTHGDFLMSNYLIDNGCVTVIDFDECEYAWYGMDLAICLRCYLTGDQPEKVHEKAAQAEMLHEQLLRGYSTENRVTHDMVYEMNRYIRIRDYIELTGLIERQARGDRLHDVEARLLKTALDRVLGNRPFLEFKTERTAALLKA